ncbi:MAG: 2Fe-2S iron-sulfur cluster binding domain-containing protein [Acidobacteria bacterium]|nr:2Fe-2S iron-sulfur cluster binding domain-containing protein [Acidobacteriota bacterium]NIM64325.1 2Fe-2S iron-sulfur cluster binding domain-containing protein [Acidobacteriota bacterium]NIQ84968.1 2Fe-2S iron-sulfur cluster binding domain-containing protein [Acidobacteriota bacterium]NIT10782.1 2Fe-2S iron-sulfur cluster binding domain-containing protein [Acidobacteriota bacterium]
MPRITIDGVEMEVPAGTTVLQAALSRGREVPHYCYHPGLSIAGNCRMCLVEVEKAPKLMIACQTQVADGMVVHTQNEKVKQAQAAVMEFLLINHPLDCPICDQAGECRLQEYAVEHGTGVSRHDVGKVIQSKAIDIGKHIMLDQERCIQCSRCIRFCNEVTGTGELDFFQRGDRTKIGLYPGKRLDNPYSGNTVDICPVGALTLKEFRFATRVWYLKNTPTVCAGCSRGCNVMVAVGKKQELMTSPGQFDDGIKRIVPRVNEQVNGHWICDEGRLSYIGLEAAGRLPHAQDADDHELDWDEAVRRAGKGIREAASAGRLGVIATPRATNETLHALKSLIDGVGGAATGVQSIHRGEDDNLLIRADKGANSAGAAAILGATGADDVLRSAGEGALDTLVVLGDLLDPADTIDLGDVATRVKQLIYIGPFADAASKAAHLRLPVSAWAEEDGTMVNVDGRVQLVRRCHRPRGEGRPGWRVMLDLFPGAGVEAPDWSSWEDVYTALSGGTDTFRGTTAESIGLLGLSTAEPAPAGA